MSDSTRFDEAPTVDSPAGGVLLPIVGTPAAGDVATYDGTVWVPQAPAGGPGGSFSYFDPDKPPAAPSAEDFEFGTPGGAGATTAFDAQFPSAVNWLAAGQYDANVTLPGGLFASLPVANGVLRARMRALPAGDFQLVVEPVPPQHSTATAYVGVVFANGTAAGAGSQQLYAFANNANALQYIRIAYTNFNTNGTLASRALIPGTRFLRVRRIGSSWEVATSANLRVWSVPDVAAPGFTPTHYGVALLNFSPDVQQAGMLSWRYSTDTAALFGGVRTVSGS